jgi:hypothetical protein
MSTLASTTSLQRQSKVRITNRRAKQPEERHDAEDPNGPRDVAGVHAHAERATCPKGTQMSPTGFQIPMQKFTSMDPDPEDALSLGSADDEDETPRTEQETPMASNVISITIIIRYIEIIGVILIHKYIGLS